MANQSSEDTKDLTQVGMEVTNILCTFPLDESEYFVVQYADGEPIKASFLENNLFVEISRFKVNDCYCAVLRKISTQQIDDVNLRAILTTRELQVVTLVASGCPNKQVADKLNISEWTVATYLRRIFAKLHVDTRAAMTYRCASLVCKQEHP